LFLHNSIILLLNKSNFLLFLAQTLCIVTAVHSGYWLFQIAM
jgi:hypothetical protein